MEVIRLDRVSLYRRTQEEFSYDFKTSLISLLEGKYRHPNRKLVLSDINLTLRAGDRVGIVGANGSGKSTLLKVICGILKPTGGKVSVSGNLAPLIELGAGFDASMSVSDNVIMYGVMLGFARREMRRRLPSILDFAELEDYAFAPVKSLSSGMKARLGFAVATDVRPDILLLDEVLSVGDAQFRKKCRRRIEKFWAENVTIIVVSHDLKFIRQWCQRAVWLEHGKIAFTGSVDETVERYLAEVERV
ncbi:ABC-type polysaccharide/polyol phosphate transport system, ATPase component [Rubidibacter lacunae KORDI 51-2]|uniref:ABC-type polysaccharide/polyol phosphate transport system, ATPase component n=1 Tax=Rubidibacter lacunae KORDI 51-2 TaxID=582515 RepID=U5DLW2_9CHRO|nr:ABC transporter ATP-binding protein [Rubidibacter lacunae]ERN41877.1 ABC-type polysaccharide/polyol phosphate transport system, ATPase component [Rubidibacter lacunae KORDI 51-2]